MKTEAVKERDWDTAAPLAGETFRNDVLAGLSRPRKSLPCKYLYDEEGARLFESISELEEYYLTRTELGILEKNIEDIARMLGPCANVVDLGSGNGVKSRLLLERLERPASYLPVDVARTQLLECSAQFAADYPELEVQPVCADYTREFDLPEPPAHSGRTTLFFPGSTVGNFEPRGASLFLRRMARLCGPTGGLLIGVDLKKPHPVLHSAYNDSQGVTARFNLNLLVRANRELKANFELEHFEHRAVFNETASRIEMHLVSRRRQTVFIEDREFVFRDGESIVTEHSYKYTLERFRQMTARAGFQLVCQWADERNWFSVQYLRPRQCQIKQAGTFARP